MAKALDIGTVGTTLTDFAKRAIYRLAHPPAESVKYRYLVVSENIGDMSHADLVVVKDLGRVKEKLKKARKGTGIEVHVAQVRTMESTGVATWLAQAQELYKFCKSSGCQFILSSGATSKQSMVSGQSMDALLELCGVDPLKHWQEMNRWLTSRLSRRVTI